MEADTTQLVAGVTLEAIPTPDLPDTESLLCELGSTDPVLTCPATDVITHEEEVATGS
jgi:hypothetical protein